MKSDFPCFCATIFNGFAESVLPVCASRTMPLTARAAKFYASQPATSMKAVRRLDSGSVVRGVEVQKYFLSRSAAVDWLRATADVFNPRIL